MNLLFGLLLITGSLSVGVFLAYGMGYRLARKYLELAVSEAEAGRYEAARQYVLAGVRLIPKFKKHPELVAFYDAILEKRASQEAPRIRQSMAEWQSTKAEKVYQSEEFVVAFVGILILCLLVKLSNLR